jgi:hypothetical protein
MKRTRHPRREMYTYTHTQKDLTAYFTTKPPDAGVEETGECIAWCE